MRLLRISAICRKHGRLISLLSALVVCSLVGIFTFMSIVANAVIVRASAACVSIALSVNPHQGNDGLPSLDIRFEPSGTHVDNHGNLKIRLDFYPGPEDKSYEQQHVFVVDETSPEFLAGYKGEVDKDGQPVDPKAYQDWFDSLPHVWRTNPCLSHFVIVPSDITKETLDAWVKQTFRADVTVTIDDAMSRTGEHESAHLISPYMRGTKTRMTAAKVGAGEDRESLVTAVNARLAGFSVGGQSGGQIEPIQPKSIDIGAAAINRAANVNNATSVNVGNPANATGTLDTWETWFNSAGTGFQVATFYVVSGNNLSTRDSEDIGNVAGGSKQTFTGTSTDVQIGDYAGEFSASGTGGIEADGSGGTGRWYLSGDNIPCTNTTFSLASTQVISLYATGTEAASVAISVAPTSYDFGVVNAGSTTNTTGNYFTITNTSGVTTNATIQMLAANWTATANGWTHSDSAAGANTAAMKASTDNGTTWSTSVFVKYNSAYNTLWTNVAANANVVFGLSLLAPTSFTNGNSNNNTVRITAFAAS